MEEKKKLKIKPTIKRLVLPTFRTSRSLWDEYGPELGKYYDIDRYANATITKTLKDVSKGANKSIDMLLDSTGYSYAYVTLGVAGALELETHMKILLLFLKLKQNMEYIFDLPLIYRPITDDLESAKINIYISSYIDFAKEQNSSAKFIKSGIKHCIAQGQFVDFMIYEAGLVPFDVESYVDINTGLMTYLDFGEVKPATVELSRQYLATFMNSFVSMSENNIRCIKSQIRSYW